MFLELEVARKVLDRLNMTVAASKLRGLGTFSTFLQRFDQKWRTFANQMHVGITVDPGYALGGVCK